MTITSPRDISGLKVWYSAEAETGYTNNAVMSGWTDLSGNGNHATPVGTDPPQWQAAAGPSSGPAVHFVGVGDGNPVFNTPKSGHFALPTNLMSGASAGEVFIRLRVDTSKPSSGQGMLHGFSNPDHSWYPHLSNIYDAFGTNSRKGPISVGALSQGSWRRLNIWSAPSDYALSLDGTSLHTTSSNTVSWYANPVLGSSAGSGGVPTLPADSGIMAPYKGWMTTVLVFSRKLTTGERADVVAWMNANPSGGNIPPPAAPTSLVYDAVGSTTLDLDWTASTGGPTGYQVRVDGGTATDVGNVTSHSFTGLTPSTGYTLEVRAYNAGGYSSWATIAATTGGPIPPGYYRVELTVGHLSYVVVRDETPDYGPVLPLTLGWQLPDTVEWFPVQADPTTLVFRLMVPDASDLIDAGVAIGEGTEVAFAMYVDPDPDALAWQSFRGVVTQLDGTTVKRDGAQDFLVTIYAADDTIRLARAQVGWSADWPIESIAARLTRIVGEVPDLSWDEQLFDNGLVGYLPARSKASGPTSALDAIRSTLRDAASDNSSGGGHVYGRPVVHYFRPGDTYPVGGATLTDPALLVRAFTRKVYAGTTTTLDGCLVEADAQAWVKLPAQPTGEWAIVDDTTYGTPDGLPPVTRSTGLLDYFGGPGGINWSAQERDNLGESLLPDGSTQLDGWFVRQLRYRACAEETAPAPVTGWCSFPNGSIYECLPVVVAPITPELQVAGEPYLAGTLSGARLTIPAGGDFYVDLRLRPELLPGTDLP